MARRTKEEAEETRQRLLDAAEQVFHAHGVSSSTLEQVAAQAGTSRGAIQWHFKDKAGLVEAMIARVRFPITDKVAGRMQESPSLPLMIIVAGVMEPMKTLAADDRARKVVAIAAHMMEYTPDFAAHRASTLDTQQATSAHFAGALVAGARLHGVKLQGDASLAARSICAMLFGLINAWVLDPDAFDLPKAGKAALQVHLRGLGFDETTLRQYGLAPRMPTRARTA